MPAIGSATARGYGYRHQQAKRRLKPQVDAGQAECAEPHCLMPTRWIDPSLPWDLAHDREASKQAGRPVYRGPAHVRCNRHEGAVHGNKKRGRRRAMVKEMRRWVL